MLAQGDNQTLHFAQFGKDHNPGVVHVVCVAHAENIATAIEIADGSGVLRAGGTNRPSALGGGLFALTLHAVSFERNE